MSIRIYIVGNPGSGGAGTTPSLQAVTDVGNTTTDSIEILDGSGNIRARMAGNSDIQSFNNTGTLFTDMLPAQFSFNQAGGANRLTLVVATLSAGIKTVLFRNLGGTVAYLTDIPVVTTPTLQQVTDAGDTTTDDIIVADGSGQEATLHADANFGTVNAIIAAAMIQLVGDKTAGTCYILYTSGVKTATIQFNGNTELANDNVYNFRDLGGTNDIAFLADIPAPLVIPTGNFNNPTFTGNTFNIAHGLGLIPLFGDVVAKNAAAATMLQGGYSVSYNFTNITVNLVVNVVVPISINLDWMAIKP